MSNFPKQPTDSMQSNQNSSRLFFFLVETDKTVLKFIWKNNMEQEEILLSSCFTNQSNFEEELEDAQYWTFRLLWSSRQNATSKRTDTHKSVDQKWVHKQTPIYVVRCAKQKRYFFNKWWQKKGIFTCGKMNLDLYCEILDLLGEMKGHETVTQSHVKKLGSQKRK